MSAPLQRLTTALACVGAIACGGMAFSGLALADSKPTNGDLERQLIDVSTQRIRQFSRTSGTHVFGRLTFRGGLVLNSPHANFGGWSGLAIDADGVGLLAVSDAGTWMTAEIEYVGKSPMGLRRPKIGPLAGRNTLSLQRERDRDAEAVTLVEGTLSKGVVLIAFEQNHRIARFEIDDRGLQSPVAHLKMPGELRQFRRNKAIEAVTIIKGGPNTGSLVAFAEGLVEPGGRHTGWIWQKGEPLRFTMNNPGEFEVTDAASLPDGSLIVLARRFRWLEGIKFRLQRVPAGAVRPGAAIEAETLLEADMSSDIDNMEGLAVHRDAGGETILTLISDNNFNSLLQRTILLQFSLEEAPLKTAKP